MLSPYGAYGFDGNGYGSVPTSVPMQPVASPAPAPVNVGGTSGTGANTFSMNLGGVNVNYDLGPSTSTLAAQSAQFLNNSFQNDANLLGGAIVGANSLVTNLAAPLISGALTQMQVNNTQLPGIYSTLMNQNFSLGQSAIQAETQTAQASIQSSRASSQAAASAGGGCYITTAVCETFGLPDDCYTLQTLRQFRDDFLIRSNVGRAFVAEYYASAPALVEKIRSRVDAREYFRRLHLRFIMPALLAIEHGKPALAFKHYRHMIYAVRAENP